MSDTTPTTPNWKYWPKYSTVDPNARTGRSLYVLPNGWGLVTSETEFQTQAWIKVFPTDGNILNYSDPVNLPDGLAAQYTFTTHDDLDALMDNLAASPKPTN